MKREDERIEELQTRVLKEKGEKMEEGRFKS